MPEAQTPNILLLESDESRRVRLRDRLSDDGFAVTCVDSVERAASYADGEAAVLLTNLLLDDGPSFDFVREWVSAGKPALGISDVFRGPTARSLILGGTGLAQLFAPPLDDDALLAQLRAFTASQQDAGAGVASVDGVPSALDVMRDSDEGDLAEHDIVALLANLARRRVNGGLMLSAEHAKKLVYFENGVPVGVKSTLEHEWLGNMLAAEGTIGPDELARSVEAMQSGGRQQGAALVELGSLTYPQLEEALQRQFVWKLEEVVAWPAGAYKYRDSPIPAAYRGAPLDDPRQLLWNAIARVAPVERAQARLWPVMDAAVGWSLNEVDLSRLSLPMPAYALTEAIDGRRTTRALVEGSEEPGLALLALYALTAFGALTYSSPSPG